MVITLAIASHLALGQMPEPLASYGEGKHDRPTGNGGAQFRLTPGSARLRTWDTTLTMIPETKMSVTVNRVGIERSNSASWQPWPQHRNRWFQPDSPRAHRRSGPYRR